MLCWSSLLINFFADEQIHQLYELMQSIQKMRGEGESSS